MGSDQQAQLAAEAAAEDLALLADLERGSQEALVKIHRRYVHLVFGVSLRVVGDRALAEEITQDVFMKLWRRPAAYDPARGRLSTWLLTVARYAAIDQIRQNRRGPDTSSLEQQLHDPPAPGATDGALAEAEEQTRIRGGLAQLPPEQREAIELAFFTGLTQQEIADFLQLPLGTVKTRMRLGMQKLRLHLTDR